MEALPPFPDRTSPAAQHGFLGLRRRGRRTALAAMIVATTIAVSLSSVGVAMAQPSGRDSVGWSGSHGPRQPDFGPNVMIFDPSMPTSRDPGDRRRDRRPAGRQPVRAAALRAAVQARHVRLGGRAAELPGRLLHQVAGLGRSPDDVVINGSVDVHNQCDANGSCIALNNFWRSLSNLTINVTNPDFGCYTGEFWAVSQAAPMRRVHVNGPDHADGLLHRPVVRQRRLHRRLAVRRHRRSTARSSSCWSATASSTAGRTACGTRCSPASRARPPQCFPAAPDVCGPYTTLATSPVTREAPYLYVDAHGRYNVFVPARATNSVGTDLGAAGRRPARRSRSTSSTSPSRATPRRRSTARSHGART